MRTLRPLPSSKAPKEEAATPFPRLEHTPPEMKINLFMWIYYRQECGLGKHPGKRNLPLLNIPKYPMLLWQALYTVSFVFCT
jgi:hypothetical protein